MQYNIDTINFEISYFRKDSVDKIYLHRDTVNLGFKKIKKKKKQKKENKFQFSTIPKRNSFVGKNKNFKITFREPLASSDSSLIRLYSIKDTIKTSIEYTFIQDTIDVRTYYISTEWTDNLKYEFVAQDSAFTNIWNIYSDSTAIPFKTRAIEEYGNIILNLTNIENPGIIQLMNTQEEIIEEREVSKSGIIRFDYLMPGNFKLKYIFDDNSNKKWDTGKYLKHLQPERVNYYSEDINIRANWDMEIDWDPNKEIVKKDIKKEKREL